MPLALERSALSDGRTVKGRRAAVPVEPVLGDAEAGGYIRDDEEAVLGGQGPVDPQGEPRPEDRS